MLRSELLRLRFSRINIVLLTAVLLEGLLGGLTAAHFPLLIDGLISLNEVIPNATNADQMPKGMLDSFALQQQSMQFVVADLSAGTGMGVSLAALGAIVFGALSASTEYRRGSMAFSSLAEPRRLTLIATKVAAVTIAAALTAVPLALCKGLALALGLTSQGISSLIDPVELVSLWGRGAIALILLALLGFGIGLITRSQVACFAIAFGGLLAESTARTLGALISGGQTSAASFLPFGLVADAVRGTSFGGLNLASIGMAAGLLTLAAWAIALLSGGVVRFIRSDVPTSG